MPSVALPWCRCIHGRNYILKLEEYPQASQTSMVLDFLVEPFHGFVAQIFTLPIFANWSPAKHPKATRERDGDKASTKRTTGKRRRQKGKGGRESQPQSKTAASTSTTHNEQSQPPPQDGPPKAQNKHGPAKKRRKRTADKTRRQRDSLVSTGWWDINKITLFRPSRPNQTNCDHTLPALSLIHI